MRSLRECGGTAQRLSEWTADEMQDLLDFPHWIFEKQFKLPPLSEQQREQLEARVEKYLDLEKTIGDFFGLLNYCKDLCITQEESLYSLRYEATNRRVIPGNIGCCHQQTLHYPESTRKFNTTGKQEYLESDAEYLLTVKREAMHGMGRRDPKYRSIETRCDYHGSKGCILEDHRPSMCLLFFCQGALLEDDFNIKYEYGRLSNAVDHFMTGRTSESLIAEVKDQFEQGIKIINSGQKPAEPLVIGNFKPYETTESLVYKADGSVVVCNW